MGWQRDFWMGSNHRIAPDEVDFSPFEKGRVNSRAGRREAKRGDILICSKRIQKSLVKHFTIPKFWAFRWGVHKTASGLVSSDTVNFCVMLALRSLLIVLFCVGVTVAGFGAESHGAAEVAEAHAEAAGAHAEGADGHAEEGGHHGLTPNAVPIFRLGPLVVTNSMLVTWVVALIIIVMSQLATKNAKLVPSGLQNFWEWLIEELYGFFESILGAELVKKSFWFFGTVFIFVLFTNWFGLLPGFGTIGWGTEDAAGHFHLSEPLLRGGNADLNMTAAMALSFFVLWVVWALQANGVQGFVFHIFAVKGHGATVMGIFLALVFLMVGLIEVVSISVRPVALMFRLYGNIFAGENILETIMHLGGVLFGWLLVLPFYFLELLVGLVQALVLALLMSVFTSLMCQHDDEHAH